MATAHDFLTLQMLEWIAQTPHPYSEVMEVWRSSCPRMSIWEDACASGLVDCEQSQARIVSVTAKGRQLLEGKHP